MKIIYIKYILSFSLAFFVSISAASQNIPFESTYTPMSHSSVLLKNANVFDGDGNKFLNTDIILQDGKIVAIGKDLPSSSDLEVVDATDKWVTPGIIDIHSHMGVYPAPSVTSSSDGNESTSPVTADVWAEHSIWVQDPQFALALKGGVTSFHILPGSANLIGGRGVTAKNVQRNTINSMKFPGAPHSLKMACGENPKRVYGNRGKAPKTRMGNAAGYRKSWIEASGYLSKLDEYEKKSEDVKEMGYKPQRDLELETLAGVLSGDILVHNHCYRAEEMAMMIDIANEFDYKITAFHHAVEAYKIADLLADNNICAALWADHWGFKHEAYDMVQSNVAIVDQARNGTGCAIVHSDSDIGIQHLNQEASKALAAGVRAGFDITQARAMKWITSNPARAAGIYDVTGSIKVGKNADVVLWSENPFSVYSLAEKVYIDGALAFDRESGLEPASDFDIGILNPSKNRIDE